MEEPKDKIEKQFDEQSIQNATRLAIDIQSMLSTIQFRLINFNDFKDGIQHLVNEYNQIQNKIQSDYDKARPSS